MPYDAALPAVLLFLVLASRVISPQYMIWLAGLASVCLTVEQIRSPAGGRPDPAGHRSHHTRPPALLSDVVTDTDRGVAIIVLRNVLLAGAARLSCVRLWRGSVVRYGAGRSLCSDNAAGHCVGSNGMFVPMYDHTKSAADQPYGVWPVKEWFRDSQYASDRSPRSDLDFAFASLKDNNGRYIQDVVGANSLAHTPGCNNKVTVIGYPMVKYDSQDRAFRCPDVQTTALPSYNQMQIDCAGMWGGVSGGPWFSSIDPSGDTGEIIGNVGGFLQGGPDVPVSDPRYNRITYSPLHRIGSEEPHTVRRGQFRK
ncbi:trypsin-like serine peptidase [Streptomyces silvisoli]|uniref:Serine protease n=1 Tax=Streptomyces silvisoli TaxID=3034235 RepID=A0ABT5ZU48_9ACTN|nr:hypothetical protein [Streptomyces silvisoli]MDF3293353.1 hypothetical protein [Streptomyces silvisoli]